MLMMHASGLEASQLMLMMRAYRAAAVPADAHDARLRGHCGRRRFLLMLMMHASGLEASQLMLMMRGYGAALAEGRSRSCFWCTPWGLKRHS